MLNAFAGRLIRPRDELHIFSKLIGNAQVSSLSRSFAVTCQSRSED